MSLRPSLVLVLLFAGCAPEPIAGTDAGPPGSDAPPTSSCGMPGRTGTTSCDVTPSGTCPSGQWCNLEMVTCSVGCTSDGNCPADEQCVRAAGEGVGVCQPCASCGDGRCDAGEACPADCGTPARCGDGVCNGIETEASCPADCSVPRCGNGVCDAIETSASCPADCPAGPVCGDGTCDPSESALGCPADCDDGRDRCFDICNDFEFFDCVSSASSCIAACDAATPAARRSFADCVNVTLCDTYDACIGLL